MHVAVDDHSRYASDSIMEDETAESVTKHFIETYQRYDARGIDIKRVLTNNGSGYNSKKFKQACETLNSKHVFCFPNPTHHGLMVKQNELYGLYSENGRKREHITLPSK